MKITKTNRQKKKRRGAALVEMALVLPIFFTVILGIIEFGRAMMVGQLVTNAAREGARMAVVEGTTNIEVETWIQGFLGDTLGVDSSVASVTITIDPADGNPNPGNQLIGAGQKDLITVDVSVPFNDVNFVPGNFLAGRNLSGRSAMRHE